MIKLIIFDLDGVLVDSRDIHYYTLNNALASVDKKYVISRDEHLSLYDGHTTTQKLKMLTKNKGLDKDLHDKIWKLKQKYTIEEVDKKFNYDEKLCDMLKKLKSDGYTIYCASNSIFNTIKTILFNTGSLKYIDYFVSNEDVKNPKPSYEIYYKCLERCNVSPSETLILEDSVIGKISAKGTGSHVYEVNDLKDVNYENIKTFIDKLNPNKKELTPPKKKINIVIPMSGEGSRFAKAGYTFPKPLIDVLGKPMIQVVTENLNINGKFIYIVRKKHYEQYNLKYMLNLISPGCEIVITDGLTEGAACSILLAKEYINNDDQLVLANSDQFLEWNSNDFLYKMQNEEIDAGISVFTSTHPKWSFAKLGDDGFVCEVAEKKPISDIATTGIYFWKKGSDFVKYAESMIKNNIRHNNEFYTCPVFNEAIKDGKKIRIDYCKRMWGIGVPEDLNYFIENYKQ